ncbi:methionyl-tRNA formyltransferase, partial [bacterium]|nr:methionyl-tRNA formyltransferase [bacterium]
MKRPRLIFMGTPDFAVPTLRELAARGFPVAAVVTRPDKPRDRGLREAITPVKQAALDLGFPVLQPGNTNTPEFLKQLSAFRPDVLVVAAFGQILKCEILDKPPLGCVNLHASLLPKYRGAAPIQWAIARGEKETGVTVQRMAAQVDCGHILMQQKLMIGAEETAPELYMRLAMLGGPAMAEVLENLAASGGKGGRAQDESQATYAPRLTREDGRIDWTLMAGEIYNRIRAFNPWPGTYTWVRGKRLKILSAEATNETLPRETVPGSIIRTGVAEGWLVAAGEGTTLIIRRVQCENSRIMTAQAFTCGYHIDTKNVLGAKG